jgi:hypothetical protein
MSKLHEVLAVEGDLQGQVNKIIEETVKTFQSKAAHFMKSHRRLEMFEEDGISHPEEHYEMVDTVSNKLNHTKEFITRYYDVVLQKEATNQAATADIIINGEVLFENAPVTFLLGMESRLKTLRQLYASIPTLQPGKKWEKDTSQGDDIYVVVPDEEKLRTKKVFAHQVLYEATKEHPAQIEKWEETKDIGKYIQRLWSSMLTPSEKSKLLGKIDTLIQAVKKARQRANGTELIKTNIGEKIFKYIHS